MITKGFLSLYFLKVLNKISEKMLKGSAAITKIGFFYSLTKKFFLILL